MRFWIAVCDTTKDCDPLVGAGPTKEEALVDLNNNTSKVAVFDADYQPTLEPTFWIEVDMPSPTYRLGDMVR